MANADDITITSTHTLTSAALLCIVEFRTGVIFYVIIKGICNHFEINIQVHIHIHIVTVIYIEVRL